MAHIRPFSIVVSDLYKKVQLDREGASVRTETLQ
jgi:hypothetical protein